MWIEYVGKVTAGLLLRKRYKEVYQTLKCSVAVYESHWSHSGDAVFQKMIRRAKNI